MPTEQDSGPDKENFEQFQKDAEKKAQEDKDWLKGKGKEREESDKRIHDAEEKREEKKKSTRKTIGGKKDFSFLSKEPYKDLIKLITPKLSEKDYQKVLNFATELYKEGKVSLEQLDNLQNLVNKVKFDKEKKQKVADTKDFIFRRNEDLKQLPENKYDIDSYEVQKISAKMTKQEKSARKVPPKESPLREKPGKEKIKQSPGQKTEEERKKISYANVSVSEEYEILNNALQVLLNKEAMYEEGKENMPAEERLKMAELILTMKKSPVEGKDFFLSDALKEDLEKEIPDFRKEYKENGDLEKFIEWFRKRIYALHEEYPEDRFDTNFTLTWPLQQALNKLHPTEADEKFKLPDKEKSLAEVMNETRRQLSKEFEAHRNFHNFIYVYKRVGGVSGVVEASNLFTTSQLATLLEKKAVMDYLKIFAKEGEKVRKLTNERLALDIRKDSPDQEKVKLINMKMEEITKWLQDLQSGQKGQTVEIEEVIRAVEFDDQELIKKLLLKENFFEALKSGRKEKIVKTSKNFTDEEIKTYKKEFQDRVKRIKLSDGWAAMLAGGAYSALHGTCEHNVILTTGDFFMARLFNVDSKAQEGWEGSWNRAPFKELYKSLRLGLKSFWFDELEGKIEDDDFVLNKIRETEDNTLTRMDVECLDADPVRKLILKPRQFIDKPTADKLNEMWVEFQHSIAGGEGGKAVKRSVWFAEILRQMSSYYQDRTAPWLENLPYVFRHSRAQEINSEWKGWSNVDIEHIINAFCPPLTEEDKEKLLREFVGTKFQRVFSKGWKNTAMVSLFVAWGAIKGVFEQFFKYLLEEKR